MLGSSGRTDANATVPDVTGKTVEEATSVLTAAGFTVGVNEKVDSSTIPEGSIVSTTPSANQAVIRGAIVPVQVSTGKTPVNSADIADLKGDLND
ncbi:PASTA domain-containing protein [Rathayibacter toxicus]|nr:PASTA domain-containing protein [Rathayibacter toxicus]